MRGVERQHVARGSWLVARGSWLVARGSWLVARGSWLVTKEGVLSERIIISVDTGGTFTDVVCARGDIVSIAKIPSTPRDPARAVIDGIRRVLGVDEARGTSHEPRFTLIHGSTVATNALLERRGATVVLVTNAGFEDVIEIGRQNRPQLYALTGHRLPAIVLPEHRIGIAGRIDASGEEFESLDAEELESLRDRIGDAQSIAVCLLHSYANPAHEQRVAAALSPTGIPLSVSSGLLPEYREYERCATTIVNAYVTPLMDGYLGTLETESGAERVRIMGSAGGALTVQRARAAAVHTVLSGPAGGVVGALEIARRDGYTDVITFDMGGTSTDVSLCPGQPLHTREFTIAGLPVAVPVIDIHTVGAGGGSIARVDSGGALRVGPDSAGAAPGPICYGRGGTVVTVTDAQLWLGRLADTRLAGGAPLDRASVGAQMEALARQIGCSADEAAEGVIEVADTAMEGALRVISVERGYDPVDFTLVAFGGAAGLHAAELAQRLGIARVLVPPSPGVLSAWGMQVAPARKDETRTLLGQGNALDADVLARVFAELDEAALQSMTDDGVPADAVSLRHLLDVRYKGQSFELRVPAEDWATAFHVAHEARYGFARRDAVLEVVVARTEATAAAPAVAVPPFSKGEAVSSDVPVRSAEIFFRGKRTIAPVYAREYLMTESEKTGPLVITEFSATTWVPPEWRVRVLASGSLLLTV